MLPGDRVGRTRPADRSPAGAFRRLRGAFGAPALRGMNKASSPVSCCVRVQMPCPPRKDHARPCPRHAPVCSASPAPVSPAPVSSQRFGIGDHRSRPRARRRAQQPRHCGPLGAIRQFANADQCPCARPAGRGPRPRSRPRRLRAAAGTGRGAGGARHAPELRPARAPGAPRGGEHRRDGDRARHRHARPVAAGAAQQPARRGLPPPLRQPGGAGLRRRLRLHRRPGRRDRHQQPRDRARRARSWWRCRTAPRCRRASWGATR